MPIFLSSSASRRRLRFVALFMAAGFVVFLGAGCSNKKEAVEERPVNVHESAAACESTLLGCDTDNNGVRDDVQQQIDAKYPASAKSREALYQDARALQSSMSDDADDSGLRNAKLAADAVECMEYVLGMREAQSDVKWLRLSMFNSADRIDAYLLAEKRMNGFAPEGHADLSAACTFKFDKPQNESAAACESTLLGCDTDNNGIRDDVDGLIAAKCQGSVNRCAVLRQAAKAMQALLRDVNNSEATSANEETIMSAAECAYSLVGIQAKDDFAWLRAHMYNTESRTLAYSQAQHDLGAQFREQASDPKTLCDFKPVAD